ncbi:MAG: hypothetical protein ACXWQ5_23370, partial [Ktedonobacterales bacterium]
IGTPATIFQPGDTDAVMTAPRQQEFARTVFGIDLEGKSEAEVKEQYASRYARALAAHRTDLLLGDSIAYDSASTP